MHIIHVQYSAPELQKVRHRDYAEIAGAIMQNDTAGAEEAARRHVDTVRTAIADWHPRRSGAGRCQLRLPIRRTKPTAIILGVPPASPPASLWRAPDTPR